MGYFPVLLFYMKYNKLVRDNIIKIIESKGQTASFHIAKTDEEYWLKLREKLLEEVSELLQDESIGEVADVLEVVDAMCMYKGFSKEDVEVVKKRKKDERGGFEKRIILEES